MQGTSPSDLILLKFDKIKILIASKNYEFFYYALPYSSQFFLRRLSIFTGAFIILCLSYLVREYVTQLSESSQKGLKSYISVDFNFMLLDKARKK